MSHGTAPASAGFEVTQVLFVVSQYVPLLHAPLLQLAPTAVVAWHVPHTAFGASAQNFVAHWASNAQAPFAATLPAPTVHEGPRSPLRNGRHEVLGIALAQEFVAETDALVPGAARTPRHVSATRVAQVLSSPKAAPSPIDEQAASWVQNALAYALHAAAAPFPASVIGGGLLASPGGVVASLPLPFPFPESTGAAPSCCGGVTTLPSSFVGGAAASCTVTGDDDEEHPAIRGKSTPSQRFINSLANGGKRTRECAPQALARRDRRRPAFPRILFRESSFRGPRFDASARLPPGCRTWPRRLVSRCGTLRGVSLRPAYLQVELADGVIQLNPAVVIRGQ
jgi:hypothetical protein